MRHIRAALPALLLALLMPAAARAEDAPLPEGVNQLPRDLSLRMKDLLKNAENYRGLKCLHAVPSGALDEAGLKKKMLLAFSEELPDAKMHPLEATLKAFGFIPQSMDLKTYYPQLLISQVGGFYDPRRQYLIIVEREGGLLGTETKKQFGEEFAKRMEDTVMVHEYTHALQDQHFDLKKYMIDDPLADKAAARVAVVEGDATLTMYDFFSGMKMENLPMVGTAIKAMMKNPKQLFAMTPDMPGAKEMEDAPAWFRENLLFSYMYGFVFCIEVKKTGGQKLLDYAFTSDPPRSTEQILHPEKWLGKRDDPIELSLADVAPPTFKKVSEGTLGELGIRILLGDSLKDSEKAAQSAQDWGGDRFAVFESPALGNFLCWVTEWDTPAAAKRFASAAKSLGTEWSIESPIATPTRVTLFKGGNETANSLATTIHHLLAKIPAQKPENKAIDLTAFGVQKRQAADDLANALKANGQLDVDKVLNNPAFDKLLDEVGKKEGGDLLGGLLNNDATKGLLKGMMKEMLAKKAPEGQIAPDGRSYKNDGVGLSVTLPASAKSWDISKSQMPMALVMIQPFEGGAVINIAQQSIPMAMPIENLGPFVEMGARMMIKNYKKLKGEIVGEGLQKCWEIQYTGAPPGDPDGKIHALQRVYLLNGQMLVVSVIANPDEWRLDEKTIFDILAAIKISPAPEAPKTDEAIPKEKTPEPSAPLK